MGTSVYGNPQALRDLLQVERPTNSEFARLRVRLSLSQATLGTKTGYTRRTIHAIEQGRREIPRARRLMWQWMQARLRETGRQQCF